MSYQVWRFYLPITQKSQMSLPVWMIPEGICREPCAGKHAFRSEQTPCGGGPTPGAASADTELRPLSTCVSPLTKASLLTHWIGRVSVRCPFPTLMTTLPASCTEQVDI